MAKLLSELKRKVRGIRKPEKQDDEPEIFSVIAGGDYGRALELLAKDPAQVHVRNNDGATPVHLAFLLCHYELGRAILLLHPGSAQDTYTYGPKQHEQHKRGLYEGENLLHMVITKRQYDVFEWLLDRYPYYLNHETTGTFFDRGKSAYFGGYPLLFAVATNQSQMVDRIVRTKTAEEGLLVNSIHAVDRYGNNALHLAIIHDLIDMANFVLHLEKEDPADVPLCRRSNEEGLIPLALAAAMGRVELFKLILDHSTHTAWEYGPTTCTMVPLRGLEQPIATPLYRTAHRNSLSNGDGNGKGNGKGNNDGQCDGEDVGDGSDSGSSGPLGSRLLFWKKNSLWTPSDAVGTHTLSRHAVRLLADRVALNCMCASERQRVTHCLPHVAEEVFEGRLRLIELPEIHSILHTKWENFGRRRFLYRFVSVLIIMVLWTVALFIPMPYRTDPAWLTDYPANNGCIIACEAVVLMWVVVTVIIDALRCFRSGPINYIRTHHGVVFVIWILQLVFCALVFALIGLRAALLYRAQLIITTFASLIGWLNVLMHCVAFETSGPYIIMIYDLMTSDIRKFAMIYMTIVVGFTTAIFLVRDPTESITNATVPHTELYFLTLRDLLIMGMVGKLLIPKTLAGDKAWLVSIWIILYLVCQVITMVSILIAMLSHTTEELWEKTESLFLIERNNLLRYFESELRYDQMNRFRAKYAQALHEEEEEVDPDLFMKVVTTKDSWKHEVKIAEMPFRDSLIRGSIHTEEEKAWDALEDQMRASGICLLSNKDAPARPRLRRTSSGRRISVSFVPSPRAIHTDLLPDPESFHRTDPFEQLYNSEEDN